MKATNSSNPPRPPGGRGDFLGLPLDDPGIDGLIDWLAPPPGAPPHAPRVAGYLNAHTANLALRSGSDLGPMLREFDLVYPDGMAVVRAARRRGVPSRERVSAGDFFGRLCWAAAARGRTMALVGGPPGLADRCAEELRRRTPGLNIAMTHHGFVAPGSPERIALKEKLLAARPDIVLVGMGSPQQEALALELRAAGLPTTWCVGALFEYFTPGIRPHAPLWMRAAGLEWLFRLVQEPRRLAKRYLIGNVEFLLRTRSG